MKRAGFTMIELIFVIVILGILAAVAVPKLSATRDDAKVSKGASDAATLVSDLGSYYTGHGSFSDTITDMTNVPLVTTAALVWGTTAGTYDYSLDGGTTNCLVATIAFDSGSVTIGASVTATVDTSTACTTLKTKLTADNIIKTHTFSGSGVSY